MTQPKPLYVEVTDQFAQDMNAVLDAALKAGGLQMMGPVNRLVRHAASATEAAPAEAQEKG